MEQAWNAADRSCVTRTELIIGADHVECAGAIELAHYVAVAVAIGAGFRSTVVTRVTGP